jgi:heme o synthase
MMKNLMALLKFRLASLVVFSAVLGYILATGVSGIDWTTLTALIIGGFLVTGGSNGLNQYIERESDKLMTRTQDRPLPTGRLEPMTALIFSSLVGILGLAILWYFTNVNAFILGLAALVSYAFIYTPMKKKSSWAVFVGAFPGAVPPMLHYLPYSLYGNFHTSGLLLGC